jgi:hypothetical protein
MEHNTTNRLVGTKVYLCGPIDRVKDAGVGWRREITPLLNERGIIVFDPCCKPLDSCQDETNHEERKRWMEEGRYDLITKFMKEVRGQDLRFVNVCDFLIARVDVDVHMCGTYEEIAIANHEKKPILVHSVGGKRRCPLWLFGQIPHEMIFDSVEEVISYLDHVDTAPEVGTYRRWFFFDQKKLYNQKVLHKLMGVS